MMKYSFVLYHADVDNFLQELQTLGMVDIRRQQKPVDELSKTLLDEINRWKSVERILEPYRENPADGEAKPADSGTDMVLRIEKLTAEREELKQTLPKLEIEIAAAKPWGAWSDNDMEALGELGLVPHFYCVSESNYDPAWENEYPIKELNRHEGKIYFVLLEEDADMFLFKEHEARFPRLPHNELQAEYDRNAKRLEQIDEQLKRLSAGSSALHEERNRKIESLDVYLAGQTAQKEAEDTIVVLTGFAPKAQSKAVETFLDEQSVVYISEMSKPEDNPPISLKNNRFAKQFEVIGDLFMPPNYQEKDVTAYFAPFYMLFFGFCLGDMGYGLVLLLLGTVAKFFMPKMKNILTLVQFLGVGSIIMAAIPGNFFGLKIADWLGIEGWRIGGHMFRFFGDLQMFWFAIIFGGVQIVFAKVMQGVFKAQRFGWQYGMSHWGWAMVMVGAGLAIGGIALPKPVLYTLLFGGLGLILFFTNPVSRNPLIRLWKGITSLYDITGLFGDLLSYIRLFGLSASGGSLGMVVNVIAGMLFGVPYVGWLFGVLILIIGHAAVLALSALGAFVHPMRLTFVEFYKNIGFEGGGKSYAPLKKQEG